MIFRDRTWKGARIQEGANCAEQCRALPGVSGRVLSQAQPLVLLERSHVVRRQVERDATF